MFESKSPFEILGVREDADITVIKAAYKALAKKYHPDIHDNKPFAEIEFKKINDAYQKLTSEDFKNVYRQEEPKPKPTDFNSTKSADKKFERFNQLISLEDKFFISYFLLFFLGCYIFFGLLESHIFSIFSFGYFKVITLTYIYLLFRCRLLGYLQILYTFDLFLTYVYIDWKFNFSDWLFVAYVFIGFQFLFILSDRVKKHN